MSENDWNLRRRVRWKLSKRNNCIRSNYSDGVVVSNFGKRP